MIYFYMYTRPIYCYYYVLNKRRNILTPASDNTRQQSYEVVQTRNKC